MATTTIIGDVVHHVAGDSVRLTVLFPRGADPHHVRLSPRDVSSITTADLIFINGGGLEGPLLTAIEQNVTPDRIVDLGRHVDARYRDDHHDHAGHDHDHEVDPHFWTDPHHVMIWARVVADRIGDIDSDPGDRYKNNADVFVGRLEELHGWIETAVSEIPEERRKLVVDHRVFGYFADRYGFEEIGVVIDSFSTLAQPSALEIGRLVDVIRQERVSAILVSTSVNPDHAARIAEDTGIRVVYYYAGSLSPLDGPAPDYLSYMRYNVSVIVNILKPTK